MPDSPNITIKKDKVIADGTRMLGLSWNGREDRVSVWFPQPGQDACIAQVYRRKHGVQFDAILTVTPYKEHSTAEGFTHPALRAFCRRIQRQHSDAASALRYLAEAILEVGHPGKASGHAPETSSRAACLQPATRRMPTSTPSVDAEAKAEVAGGTRRAHVEQSWGESRQIARHQKQMSICHD